MNKIVLFILSLFTLISYSQQKSKVKILLLGTIHFENPHKDKFELKSDDFLSEKRQQEIENLVNILKKTKATKVLIERPFDEQKKQDSLYNEYCKNKYKISVSEREQIGFRLAKKLNLTHINCVDALFGNPHDSIMVVSAKEYDQMSNLENLSAEGKKLLSKITEKQKTATLIDILKYINSSKLLQQNLQLYLKNIAKIGAGKNYAGAESVSDWYLRNLAIYSNVITQINYKEDSFVILIFGQGHIPILKHFLENNDDFEIVEVKDVLK